MKIKTIIIQNWRSIKEMSITTSSITTLVGKNNNGKSNILSAILFFFGEIPKVTELDFNDKQHEIVVEVCFHSLDTKDKQQFKKYVSPLGELTIRKTATTNFELDYRGYIETPVLEYLREENISEYSSREKAPIFPFFNQLPTTGRLLKEVVRQHLVDYIDTNKATIEFERRLEGTHFMGNRNIAQGLLGEVLHIPPISSAPDELNTKGNTAFNKLYQKLASKVTISSPLYQEAQRAMRSLVGSLNRLKEDGSTNEARPEGLIKLESTVADYLESWQTSLHIEFDLKGIDESIKLNTNILVDDGIKTDISRKGNGLQRSLIFALIKSWAKILREEMDQEEEEEEQEFKRSTSNSYFFIFEEPELFLHPHAQRELFDSLKLLTNDNNQVFMATHSSSFLKVEDYSSVISVCKNNLTEGTTAIQCNEELFNTLEDKQRFDLNQWLCPTRSELFFASKVVLVEGATDEVVIPFLAKKMGVYQHSFSIINCGGKGSFPLYMKLLNSFKIKYVAVYDKDQRTNKLEDAIATAIRQSAKVESALDSTVGSTVIMDNDIEEELNFIGVSKSNKPYTALKSISADTFIIPNPLLAKIATIYSTTQDCAVAISIDDPEAEAILGTLSVENEE